MQEQLIQEQLKVDQNNFSIGIIGCGWLGKALAITLLKKNISVLATSRKPDNVEKLTKQGIPTQQLVLPIDILSIDHDKLKQHDIFTQKCLVIAITPQFKQGRTDYANKIAQLVSAAQHQNVVQHIILLSSTAVYHGLIGDVNENSQLNLAAEKVKILHAAEQSVLNFSKQPSKQGNVIRLAGLLGPDRHPGKFILAKKTLNASNAPVNLIHQQDAVGLIISLMKTNAKQEIYNGVSDTHVSKQYYYQIAAKALSLQPPIFLQKKSQETNRIVCGEKAKQILRYKFIYPDLLTWL